MPEANESIQATGVNWARVRYEVSFFVLNIAAGIAQIWYFRVTFVSPHWRTLGRQLAIVFVAASLAGLIADFDDFGARDVPALALLRVVIFPVVLGHVLTWVRFRAWHRGRLT